MNLPRMGMWLCVTVGMLSLTACKDPDQDLLKDLIQQSISEGLITRAHYTMASGGQPHMIQAVVSGVLPHQARDAAQRMCNKAAQMPLREQVKVETVLLVGDRRRPAGACYSR